MSTSSFCQRGRELLSDLQRSDFLPPYDDDGVRVLLLEMEDLKSKLEKLTNEYSEPWPDPVKVTLHYYTQCLYRNHRYINAYLTHRLAKTVSLRWETGPVLPERIRHNTLSARENDFYMAYNDILSEYNDAVGLDLTGDLEPPKELLIEIRVVRACGEIMTENGPVNLTMGSTHFLRRADVEHLIRQGHLEHVQSDEI